MTGKYAGNMAPSLIEKRYNYIKKIMSKNNSKKTFAERLIGYHNLVLGVFNEYYGDCKTENHLYTKYGDCKTENHLEKKYGDDKQASKKCKSEIRKLESHVKSLKNFKLNNRTLFKSSNHTLDSRL